MGHLLLRTALATTLGVGLQFSALPPAAAQGVPVVDTQNIAQN
ncbi:MAG: conjugal transfer protein TraF, partial [Rhodobacteraceae bacterium]